LDNFAASVLVNAMVMLPSSGVWKEVRSGESGQAGPAGRAGERGRTDQGRSGKTTP